MDAMKVNTAKHQLTLVESSPSENRNDQQLALLRLEELAFDEMNLVEIPFCTLQRKVSNRTRINLSPNGEEYLVTSGEHLPTALATPVVLGLYALTQDTNRFESPTVRFKLRDLVERYMYPDQFTKHRAVGRLLKAVEDELLRIKITDIYSPRWYNRSENKHVKMATSIFADLEIDIDTRPKMVKLIWGPRVFESVRAKYTKPLDVRLWLKIKKPLDQALFRWLDRQLSTKSIQHVKSCQNFSKYKLLMQDVYLEKGGRTASSRVAAKLKKSLDRLNGFGFSVRMLVDKSQSDFSLTFEKISGSTNEIIEIDEVGELLDEFRSVFTGTPKGAKRVRSRSADRGTAKQWIQDYGFEKALWMVKKCGELHKQDTDATPRYYLRGLEKYELLAASAYELYCAESAGQLRLKEKNKSEDKLKENLDRLCDSASDELWDEAIRLTAEQGPFGAESAKKGRKNPFVRNMLIGILKEQRQ